jgi:tripartite-type tricarboxylate transporter receptor subunit TctC
MRLGIGMKQRWQVCLAGMAVAGLVSGMAAAQNYPARPVRVIVPFAAGGGTDLVARAVVGRMGENMGQQFLVDNRGGGSANIGMELAAKAAPDGYTIIMASSSLAINPNLFVKLPFDPIKDFSPISLATIVPYVLAVHPSFPARTIPDMVNLAKSRKTDISYGTAGVGNATHLAMVSFVIFSGLNNKHVPYKGTGQALIDLLGGHVAMIWGTIPPIIPHLKSGRLAGLAVSTANRTKALPDVPAIAEFGYAGYEVASWFGLLAPSGTSKDIVNRLSQEAIKALAAPDLNTKLASEGAEPVGNSPEVFAAFIRTEIGKYGKLIKAAGLKLE